MNIQNYPVLLAKATVTDFPNKKREAQKAWGNEHLS